MSSSDLLFLVLFTVRSWNPPCNIHPKHEYAVEARGMEDGGLPKKSHIESIPIGVAKDIRTVSLVIVLLCYCHFTL